MVDEVVFHLGDPKTGSTSIQHSLASGNWRCDSRSLFYSARINHLPLAATLCRNPDRKFRENRFRRLAADLAASDADVAVVSAELFETVDPQELYDALREFLPEHAETARFVAYLRPHADRMLSAYAERIKIGSTIGTLEQLHQNMLANARLTYAPRLRKWRAVFGDRYTVRPMIRDQLFARDVVRDFLNIVFNGAPFDLIEASGSNESLCLEDLAMLREMNLRMNRDRSLAQVRLALGWRFSGILSSVPRTGSTKLAMHRSLAQEVVATYREDAALIDAEFFEGAPMSAALNGAVEKAIDHPQSVECADHFPPPMVRTIRVLASMAAHLVEHDPESIIHAFRSQTAEALAQKKVALQGMVQAGTKRRKKPGKKRRETA